MVTGIILLYQDLSTLRGFVDGTAVVSTTAGVSGNTIGANETFNFFGGLQECYNLDGQFIDAFVYIDNQFSLQLHH